MSKPDYAAAGRQIQRGLTPEKLKTVADLVRKARDLESDIAGAERNLESLKKQRAQIVGGIVKGAGVIDGEIPTIFKEAGIERLDLDGGIIVKVGEEIWCSISEENRAEAHAWLRSIKCGSLIKVEVTAAFGMGQEKKAETLYKKLMKEKYAVTKEERVHPSTLKSFVKEALAGDIKDKDGNAVALPPSISYITAPAADIKRKDK